MFDIAERYPIESMSGIIALFALAIADQMALGPNRALALAVAVGSLGIAAALVLRLRCTRL